VPNGIPKRFFEATTARFTERFRIEPGSFSASPSIDAHMKQLGLARALGPGGRELVLIGPCEPEHRPYLDQLTALPRVRYQGPLAYGDPLLASAYAAAGVFCLASHSEVMPLCILESLAAGTPAVMTRNHGMGHGAHVRLCCRGRSGFAHADRPGRRGAVFAAGATREARTFGGAAPDLG
jgi:hypothetical protein